MKSPHASQTRRHFLQTTALGAATLGLLRSGRAADKVIQGFETTPSDANASAGWKPISDRKIRVGIAGNGVCRFGPAFGFQNHPNVEVIGVAELDPALCADMAKVCKCSQQYPSLEKMIENDRIEAVFIATDAPSHARLAVAALKKGKHVGSAVPAVFGSLEEADELFHAVKSSGRKYMMFETSCFHEDLYAMRQLYKAGALGQVLYSEGEYYHYMPTPIDSYKGWRVGLPPQWYPTHSNAYLPGVTGERFTHVSCYGTKSVLDHLRPANNPYKNAFGTEIATFETSGGGVSRMAVSWDTPGSGGEMGRLRGQKGSYYGKYDGLEKTLPDTKRPPLPPGMPAGGHGGSHGHLTNEFISAILQDRTPMVDITLALNLTVAGIVAHKSALRDGERLKIPQYTI